MPEEAPAERPGKGRVVLKALTEGEKATRVRALEVSKVAAEEARERAKAEAERLALDEARFAAEREAADVREAEESERKKDEEEAKRKAIAAQIIQLIESNRVEDRDGEIVYNFTDANVVKRIFVSERCHKHLRSGHLCIAKLGEGYELVPKPVAEKIKQRDTHCIIINDHSTGDSLDHGQDTDDPYADYKIPDNLIW